MVARVVQWIFILLAMVMFRFDDTPEQAKVTFGTPPLSLAVLTRYTSEVEGAHEQARFCNTRSLW